MRKQEVSGIDALADWMVTPFIPLLYVLLSPLLALLWLSEALFRAIRRRVDAWRRRLLKDVGEWLDDRMVTGG